MRKIIFEVCAETVQACVAAQAGGAARVELCSALSEGGLTPSHGLIRSAMARCTLPVHAMIRPRGGDYVYSDAEIEVMRDDIAHMKSLGVEGVVLGLLREDDSVDIDATRRLVELAQPMEVTFHRAFDSAPSLPEALEDVIAAGCRRVLTSGGEGDVIAGAKSLTALVKQAAGRIDVAVGGGLRLEDAARLAEVTGATHFHASMRQSGPEMQELPEGRYLVRADAVRSMIEELRGAAVPKAAHAT